jgi:hypothetical protein
MKAGKQNTFSSIFQNVQKQTSLHRFSLSLKGNSSEVIRCKAVLYIPKPLMNIEDDVEIPKCESCIESGKSLKYPFFK